MKADNRYRYAGVERFPAPKGGGSIEGRLKGIMSTARWSSFQRRKAVAPLKDSNGSRSVRLLCCFQRRKAVAPLKGRHLVSALYALLVSSAERRWLH